jgi:hypothetical protein
MDKKKLKILALNGGLFSEKNKKDYIFTYIVFYTPISAKPTQGVRGRAPG